MTIVFNCFEVFQKYKSWTMLSGWPDYSSYISTADIRVKAYYKGDLISNLHPLKPWSLTTFIFQPNVMENKIRRIVTMHDQDYSKMRFAAFGTQVLNL